MLAQGAGTASTLNNNRHAMCEWIVGAHGWSGRQDNKLRSGWMLTGMREDRLANFANNS